MPKVRGQKQSHYSCCQRLTFGGRAQERSKSHFKSLYFELGHIMFLLYWPAIATTQYGQLLSKTHDRVLQQKQTADMST